MKILQFYAVILGLIVSIQAAIHVRKGRLVDERGGELIFHGLNLVSKNPPYHTLFNETDMRLFQQLGINGIRLGVMWPGVQPKKGQFNQTYLSLMRKTVDKSGEYGIFTLVQFHQDLFSQKFCADGVPVWAIPRQLYEGFPRPIQLSKFKFDDKGFPRNQDCGKHPWSEYYATNAVGKSFNALWNNKHNMRDMFIRYWIKVAQAFKTSKKVIAYELINEPWPGDQYRNPLVMIPGLSQKINMQHAYDLISQAIRQEDPDHSICFEPVTWLNYFKAGFTHPPGGKRYANTSIFCYHYYNPPTFNLQKFMKARMNDIKRLKTGGILSQFYVINAQGEKNIQMMQECDKNLQSWFGWIYDISKPTLKHMQSQDDLHDILYDTQGQVNSVLVKAITRTYAQRVAGQTISQYYDSGSRKFKLSYYICTSCGQTTIFVSRKHIYKNGFSIQCYPKGGVTCQQKGEHYIQVLPKNIQDGQQVLIFIEAL